MGLFSRIGKAIGINPTDAETKDLDEAQKVVVMGENTSAQEKTVLCERCRGFFPYADVKYVPKGDSMIALCSACRQKLVMEEKNIKSQPQQRKVSEKIPYFCTRCKYKFKHNPNSLANLICPYCGMDDKIVEDKAIF